MKLFRCILLLAASHAIAQTTISDRIYSPLNGTLFEGRLQITAPDLTYGGKTYVRGAREYVVTAGNFTASLIPNDIATPPGTAYTVRYIPANGSPWTEYWTVPTSATPVMINAIRASVAPTPSTSISWNQLTGVPPLNSSAFYRVSIASATSVTIPALTHGFQTANLAVTCANSGGASVEPGQVTVNPSTFAVTITFAVAQTGTCSIWGASASYSQSFAAVSSVSLPASLHLLPVVTRLTCYDSAGGVIQTGAATFTAALLDLGGAIGNTFDVSISFATAQTGRCALLGV